MNDLTKEELEIHEKAFLELKNNPRAIKNSIEEIKIINNKKREEYNKIKVEILYNYA